MNSNNTHSYQYPQSQPNWINEDYIREMEKNSQLFEMKMRQLNKCKEEHQEPFGHQSSYNQRQNTQLSGNIQSEQHFNDHEEFTPNSNKQKYNQSNNINNEYSEQTPPRNQRRYDLDSNYNEERQQNNNQKSNDKKLIEHLRNEISYKDTLISELQDQWANWENNNINSNNYHPNQLNPKEIETMQNDLDAKYTENSRLKEENENWKMKIENWRLENTNIKVTHNKQINQSENWSIQLAEEKEEMKVLHKRVNDWEIANKKINKEYDTIAQNMSKTLKESTSLQSELAEMKAKNYNLEQEWRECKRQAQRASLKTSQMNSNNMSSNERNILKEKTNNNTNYSPNTNNENNFQYYQQSSATDTYQSAGNLNTNHYSKGQFQECGNGGTGYNAVRSSYNMNKGGYENTNASANPNAVANSTFDGFNYFPSEHKIKETKNEMFSLNNQLSSLLKEKTFLENELFKLPEKPRTWTEIKAKKEKNESIQQIDLQINQVKTRIRHLNN